MIGILCLWIHLAWTACGYRYVAFKPMVKLIYEYRYDRI